MVTKQKLIAVLVLSLFTLQNCAKGVNPTPVTGSGNENTDNGQISASLCALEGDGDDDHDGICNKDDVAANGTDCSQQAEGCITPGQDDGMSKPKKNKTWLYITGAVAAVGAGSVAAKIVTGHWWWKGSGSNDATQLVKIANDGKTVTLSSTESFFTRNGALEGITRIKSQVGKLIWDLEYIANEHVAKGDNVDVCIHGNLGVTYAGQLLNITDGYNQRVDVKYYFYEGSTAPDVPSYYDQFSKGVKMEKSAFDHLCDVGGRFGQYVAYETDDGKYFVSAIPLQTETQQIEKAVVIAYLFNGIPTSDADVLSNLKYKRYDPAHVGDINYSTGVHDVTAFSGSVQIAGGDSTVQKYKKVFGDGTHTTKTNGILTTQQNLIQQDKDAIVACSPDLCN